MSERVGLRSVPCAGSASKEVFGCQQVGVTSFGQSPKQFCLLHSQALALWEKLYYDWRWWFSSLQHVRGGVLNIRGLDLRDLALKPNWDTKHHSVFWGSSVLGTRDCFGVLCKLEEEAPKVWHFWPFHCHSPGPSVVCNDKMTFSSPLELANGVPMTMVH